MSFNEEIKLIKKQLSQLQSRLATLEVKARPSVAKENKDSSSNLKSTRNNVVSKKRIISHVSSPSEKVLGSSKMSGSQTLRSRSFEVIRHLINVVDLARIEELPSYKSKKTNCRKEKINVPVPSFQTNFKVQDLKKPTKSDSPRIFHPKRTHKDEKILSTLHSNKKNIIEASSKLNTEVPKQIQAELDVFKYNNMKLYSSRFALLKLNPDVSELLPVSKLGHRFIATSLRAEIKELPQKSEDLIDKKILGIWEWKDGTSTARLHQYKIPSIDSPISNRNFKFVGFACVGDSAQQPPRIKDLPDDISQSCDTLRWYWFRGLWLLYYFD